MPMFGGGQACPFQLGVYDDSLIVGLHNMAEAVHNLGGCMVPQSAYAGFFADAALTGEMPVGFSQVEDFDERPHKAMTVEDIHDLVEAFGRAASRAKEAGFDGVQIHAAHGYFLSQEKIVS